MLSIVKIHMILVFYYHVYAFVLVSFDVVDGNSQLCFYASKGRVKQNYLIKKNLIIQWGPIEIPPIVFVCFYYYNSFIF